jgi:predicted nucleic acid-binding protein
LSTDLAAAIRRLKPHKRLSQLRVRPRDALVHADDIVAPGRPNLLLDTNVYILEAAGRLPTGAQALVGRALTFHCSVCLSELATGVANADPTRANWPGVRDHYSELFDQIPATRLVVPDEDTWLEAGLIAGTLARTQGFQPHQRKECLNDALIYLTAAKSGWAVLTANRDEFDLIQQLAGRGTFVHF